MRFELKSLADPETNRFGTGNVNVSRYLHLAKSFNGSNYMNDLKQSPIFNRLIFT